MLFFHLNSCFQTPRKPGQTSIDEVKKSDLRTELLAAEAEARAKKRKAAGLPVEDGPPAVAAIEDEDANKRRKVLQEALELDKDADSDEDSDGDDPKGDARCVARLRSLSDWQLTFWRSRISGSQIGERKPGGSHDGNDDENGGDEDEDDEDDTAELFRELEKIKRERAAEKARVEQAEAAVTEAEREERIATANPLLNLAAALGTAQGVNTTAPGTFAVKRRWDDGAS